MEQLLFITTKNKVEAEKISRTLVKEKLASCVNYWDGVDSIYCWKGKIEEASEGILLVKTTKPQAKKVVARIKSLHSYECPCILILHGKATPLHKVQPKKDKK